MKEKTPNNMANTPDNMANFPGEPMEKPVLVRNLILIIITIVLVVDSSPKSLLKRLPNIRVNEANYTPGLFEGYF